MSDLATWAARLNAWMLKDALPVWWSAGADHARGGFEELLGLDGRSVAADRRLRVQARQTYVYAVAGALGWDGPWRGAAEHGLAYMLDRYLKPDGLFRTLAHADGSPADETEMLYDQAFALFALGAAAKALPDRHDELIGRARAVLAALKAGRAVPAGGFIEADAKHPYQSNPHMHVFEASLALAEIDPDGGWAAVADEVAHLCLTRFIAADTGALREFFDAEWRPAAGIDGRIVEPGHQFEWAWLMTRWSRRRGRGDGEAAARRLFQNGLKGVDAARNVAQNQMLDDFSIHDAGARLWPQTERIKAALILGDEAEAVRGIEGLWRYLQTPTPGLWRDKLTTDSVFVEEPAPASSFYHITVSIETLNGA